jgi:hypothetical protein
MHKKAQSGIGAFGTYGFSAFMLMTVVGGMGYFAADNIDQFTPEICILGSGMACTDYLIDGQNNGIAIEVTYGLPKSIIIKEIEFSDEEGVISNCKGVLDSNNQIEGGQKKTYTIGKVGNEQGVGTCNIKEDYKGKVKADINLKYRNQDSSLTHTVHGALAANIE